MTDIRERHDSPGRAVQPSLGVRAGADDGALLRPDGLAL